MTHHLVVAKPFLNFARGNIIFDAAKIAEILSSEHKKFVIKVASPDASRG
jgi:hypothetical protein